MFVDSQQDAVQVHRAPRVSDARRLNRARRRSRPRSRRRRRDGGHGDEHPPATWAAAVRPATLRPADRRGVLVVKATDRGTPQTARRRRRSGRFDVPPLARPRLHPPDDARRRLLVILCRRPLRLTHLTPTQPACPYIRCKHTGKVCHTPKERIGGVLIGR